MSSRLNAHYRNEERAEIIEMEWHPVHPTTDAEKLKYVVHTLATIDAPNAAAALDDGLQSCAMYLIQHPMGDVSNAVLVSRTFQPLYSQGRWWSNTFLQLNAANVEEYAIHLHDQRRDHLLALFRQEASLSIKILCYTDEWVSSFLLPALRAAAALDPCTQLKRAICSALDLHIAVCKAPLAHFRHGKKGKRRSQALKRSLSSTVTVAQVVLLLNSCYEQHQLSKSGAHRSSVVPLLVGVINRLTGYQEPASLAGLRALLQKLSR